MQKRKKRKVEEDETADYNDGDLEIRRRKKATMRKTKARNEISKIRLWRGSHPDRSHDRPRPRILHRSGLRG